MVSKQSLVFLAAVVNSGIAFVIFLVTKLLPGDYAGATAIFIGAVGNAALIWIAAEETSVPAPIPAKT